MKILIPFLSVLLLNGCLKEALTEEQTDNREFRLARLFSHDGCTVYRFLDDGHHRYYVDCRGRTMSSISCGKNCVEEQDVETVR